jgi:beta-glucuronidase
MKTGGIMLNLFKLQTKLVLLILLLSCGAFAQLENTAPPVEVKSPPINIYGREQIDLGGKWKYIADPFKRPLKRSSRRWNFHTNEIQSADGQLVEYEWATSPEMTIPGDWNYQVEEFKWYHGLIWFAREINYREQPGKRVFLNFEAVNYRAHVFLNGVKIGEHEGGFTPFAFELTGKLKGNDFLVVGVDGEHTPVTVPGRDFDWWNYNGITRPVSLVVVPETYIHDYSVQYDKAGKIYGFVQLDGNAEPFAQVEMAIPELKVRQNLKADATGRANFEFAAPRNLQLWSPETPKLYSVEFKSGGDSIKEDIGFRWVETRGHEIFLNGKSIYLRGICLHEEIIGAVPSRTLTWQSAEELLKVAKDLNTNFVRLAHYPHSEKMTRLADKMGLLVWSEIPVYQGRAGDVDFKNPRTLQVAKNMMTENVERDKNRASIIIWSIANETPLIDGRLEFLKSLAEHTRKLDSTRLISAALDTAGVRGDTTVVDDPLGEHLDVLAINTYIGWYGDGLPDIIMKRKWETSYNKPMIFSEFGTDAPIWNKGDKMTRWTLEYQQYFYEETLKSAARYPFIRGTSPWILKDFRSPRRWHYRYQNFWNRKGLISETGERKPAFKTLADWYKQIAERENQNRPR